MTLKHIVKLTKEEREKLLNLLSKVKVSSQKSLKARILLKADEGEHGESWNDEQIAEAFDISTRTIGRLRKKFVTEGFEAALERKPYPSTRRRIFEGEEEAHLIALCCNEPPEGHAKWSLRLLESRVIELKIVDKVSYETVRKTLKKMNLNLGKK